MLALQQRRSRAIDKATMISQTKTGVTNTLNPYEKLATI